MKSMSVSLPNLAAASFMIVGSGVAWAQDGAPILLLPAPAPSPAYTAPSPQSGYLRTTTDTLEYCKELLTRIGKLMSDLRTATTAQEARNLSEQGEQLCERGHTKGGILRLRQAYVLLSPTAKAGN